MIKEGINKYRIRKVAPVIPSINIIIPLLSCSEVYAFSLMRAFLFGLTLEYKTICVYVTRREQYF